jgi:hypothetical protein
MTFSPARFARDSEKLSSPAPRATTAAVGFMELARQMRADEQLQKALCVPGTALLGLAGDGVPLMIRLASPDVTHVLISGARHSGKSALAATIAASLVLHQKPREIQIFVLTQQPQPFQFLAAAPHTQRVIAATNEQILQQMRRLEAEMERREQSRLTRPRLIVFADALTDWNPENEREYQVRLARLAQRGRAAGISLVICQNRETVLHPRLKPYFPVQLTAVPHARNVFDLYAGGERVRFQTALLAQADLPAFYAALDNNLHARPKTASNRFGEMWERLKRAR